MENFAKILCSLLFSLALGQATKNPFDAAGLCQQNEECRSPTVCIRGKCVINSPIKEKKEIQNNTALPGTLGFICRHSGECIEPLICLINKCVNKRTEGQSCSNHHHCHLPLLCKYFICAPMEIFY